MPFIIVDLSGSGGLVTRYQGDRQFSGEKAELRINGAANQYAGGVANPIRKFGYLGPANNTFVDVTASNLAQTIRAIEIDQAVPRLYLFENGTKIHRSTSLTGTTSDDRTISGATGTDLCTYTVNGVKKLFYLYKTASAGNIGIHDFSSAYNDTWLSGTVAGAFTAGNNNLKMTVADNGLAYVIDGSYVHKIDGTIDGGANGTVSPNVLEFPATFQLVDLLDSGGLLWLIVVEFTGDALSSTPTTYQVRGGVYIWDRQTTTIQMRNFIAIPGVLSIRNLFLHDNIVHCFTVGSHNFTQIRAYNGTRFEIVREAGATAYPKYPDSVTYTDNGIIWLGADGIMYFYGHPTPESGNIICKLGDVTSAYPNFVQPGAVFNVVPSISTVSGESSTPEIVWLSGKNSGTAIIERWYPFASVAESATDIQSGTSNVKSLVLTLPKLSHVDRATLFYPPTGQTNTTPVLDVNFFLNQSSTGVGTTTLTNADGGRGFKNIPINKSNVDYLQIGMAWKNASNPIRTTITPQYAKIDYHETGKLK